MLTETAREARVRRRLRRLGCSLHKTPSRSWLRQYYGPGFMVVDDYRNTVVLGCTHREYEASLEDVEDYLTEL